MHKIFLLSEILSACQSFCPFKFADTSLKISLEEILIEFASLPGSNMLNKTFILLCIKKMYYNFHKKSILSLLLRNITFLFIFS